MLLVMEVLKRYFGVYAWRGQSAHESFFRTAGKRGKHETQGRPILLSPHTKATAAECFQKPKDTAR
jgi:hypothetical protein